MNFLAFHLSSVGRRQSKAVCRTIREYYNLVDEVLTASAFCFLLLPTAFCLLRHSPSRIRMVREQTAAASGLCVIMMIVWLNFSFSSRNISSTICEFSVSRFPVGSSARMIAGLLTIARASATRCCSPPEARAAYDASCLRASSSRKHLAAVRSHLCCRFPCGSFRQASDYLRP